MLGKFLKNLFKTKPHLCHYCHSDKLQVTEMVKATILVAGSRAPALYTHFSCPACGEKYREDHTGKIEELRTE